MQIGHALHRSRPEMLLVANRAGAVLDHIRFVQVVFFLRAERRIRFVALLAFMIDRTEIDPMVEPVLDDAFEFCRRQVVPRRGVLVMTLGAILLELRMMAGNFSRAEKFFADALLKNELLVNDDGRYSAGQGNEARAEARHSPRMLPFVIAEIAFVTLGNLFLGSSRRGHD